MSVERALQVSVSLRPEQKERLDELAKSEGLSRSGMVQRLLDRHGARVPEVRVDGRRFVPARGRS